jgi:hypothetical protein
MRPQAFKINVSGRCPIATSSIGLWQKSFPPTGRRELSPILAERQDQQLEILEIVSWEGRSAIFFLRFFGNCRLTCIDTFQGSIEHTRVRAWAKSLPNIEERFDRNLAEFGFRVTKIKGRSSMALAQLSINLRQFDLVYIDGSHNSADVLSDAVLTWPMVSTNGIVIFDDYEWRMLPMNSIVRSLGSMACSRSMLANIARCTEDTAHHQEGCRCRTLERLCRASAQRHQCSKRRLEPFIAY